ncbi:MAG: hypothetical protein Q9221_001285 [Calogaya cf. arnoldii]
MDHSTPRPHPRPSTTSSISTPTTSDTCNCIEALPIKQLTINPSNATRSEPPNPSLDPQPTAKFLSLPTEIHLLIFERLHSIHTLCLVIQTCKHLHTFWLHNALSIIIIINRTKNHADRGCELVLLQQRNADAKVPNWRESTHDKDEEEQREQANRTIAERMIRNNNIVYQASENLLSQLRWEEFNVDLWICMRARIVLSSSQQAHEGATECPVGVGSRAEIAAKVALKCGGEEEVRGCLLWVLDWDGGWKVMV